MGADAPIPAERGPLCARTTDSDLTVFATGAPIGWYRDWPSYELVVGVSFLSPARMRFRRGATDARGAWETTLAPRSAYVLVGAARWAWQHHLPPAKNVRYSTTFRSPRG
jgi:DNA oxidative demethylase